MLMFVRLAGIAEQNSVELRKRFSQNCTTDKLL